MIELYKLSITKVWDGKTVIAPLEKDMSKKIDKRIKIYLNNVDKDYKEDFIKIVNAKLKVFELHINEDSVFPTEDKLNTFMSDIDKVFTDLSIAII